MLLGKLMRREAPENLQDGSCKVFRPAGNRPFAGIKAGDIFHVPWIVTKYADVYKRLQAMTAEGRAPSSQRADPSPH